MIRLHPIPDVDHSCPYCQVRLEVRDWYIPGMRNLADLRCPQCYREFYSDLPAGHGLYYPMLLDRATGVVHDAHGVNWFAKWLGDSYVNRVNSPVEFTIEDFRPLKQPVLLNCLDRLYGHCLLKLLNAQYYLDQRPDLDLIVLVPHFLRWMVPEGIASIWTVDLPLNQGIEWNDWLASEIKQRIERLEICWLSLGFSHPHPEDYDIERFTRVRPFPIDEWDIRLKQPMVTFIWREDRVWEKLCRYGRWQRLTRGLKRKLGLAQHPLHEQKQRVGALAQILPQTFPQLDFAVAGLGQPGGLSHWITDLRTLKINKDVERVWCERCAQSHVVIGVHGSNMLLPSAHAGAVVELVPTERWGNLVQDILPTAGDVREVMFRYRFLPLESSVDTVAKVTVSLLRDLSKVLLNFNRPLCDHQRVSEDPWLIVKRRGEIKEKLEGL